MENHSYLGSTAHIIIPPFGKQKQEDCYKFKASLFCTESSTSIRDIKELIWNRRKRRKRGNGGERGREVIGRN